MKRFVIGIGSQRAGSTLLHRILEQCTDIFMHPVKELHYYDTLFEVRGARALRVFSKRQLDREWARLVSEDTHAYIDEKYRCYLNTNLTPRLQMSPIKICINPAWIATAFLVR